MVRDRRARPRPERRGPWRSLALIAACAAGAGAQSSPTQSAETKLQQPIWAYAVPAPRPDAGPVHWDDTTPLTLEGSTRQYTMAEIHSTAVTQAKGVADWYPDDHPPMPVLVEKGDASRNIRPCALCHLPNGVGRPENGPVGGLPRAYIVQQLKDMKSGRRKSAEPLKTNVETMIGFAKAMTPAEMDQVARYFSSLPRRTTVKVVETDAVPIMKVGTEIYLPVKGDGAGTEPIGERLLETSDDPHDTEELRDPHGVFTAYVPIGALNRGKALVKTGEGGRIPPCMSCHGPNLTGMGAVPGIAGRSPSYLARQINDFRRHARRGVNAAPMEAVAARLSDKAILEAVAYVASLPPSPRRPRR